MYVLTYYLFYYTEQTHVPVITDRVYTCALCAETFEDAGRLKSHSCLPCLPGEKRPYMCDVCGQSNNGPKQFKEHMLTHTTERPYKCEISKCDYQTSAGLKLHMRSHSHKSKREPGVDIIMYASHVKWNSSRFVFIRDT